MSIQELINEQTLIKDWQEHERRVKAFEDARQELESATLVLESNAKYSTLATEEEKTIVNNYKTKLNLING